MLNLILYKLAVSPQPRISSEHISVTNNTHLTVKVEGVLLHGNNPNMFRKTSGIVLTLTSQITARANASHEFKVRLFEFFKI